MDGHEMRSVCRIIPASLKHTRVKPRSYSAFFALPPVHPGQARSLSVAAALAAMLLMLAAIAPPTLAASDQVPTIQEIDARSQSLERREQALRSTEADLDARLARLTQIKDMVRQMLDEAKSIQDPRIKQLIAVYTNMKAQQAATDLETMDQSVAVKILSGMKGRQAGEILTRMSTKGAEKLTAALTVFQVGKDLPKLP